MRSLIFSIISLLACLIPANTAVTHTLSENAETPTTSLPDPNSTLEQNSQTTAVSPKNLDNPDIAPTSNLTNLEAPNNFEHFPIPKNLQSAIKFWKNIYTHHDSSKVVIHDRENMELIWDIVSLPVDNNGRVNERLAKNYLDQVTKNLKNRLNRLALTPIATDSEDMRLLNIVQQTQGRLQGASERLRSQRGVADHFSQGCQRVHEHLVHLQKILQKEGVPAELIALTFVESSFNPKARSKAGAAGAWQLMPRTARALGLKVSRRFDERYDILKATQAAARLLRKNYEALGSWPLALTAYNHGPNGVLHAVFTAGSTDLSYLIDNYEKATWGFASKNFYAEFLAALEVLASHPLLPDGALALTPPLTPPASKPTKLNN